jgi:enoyl-CoA hydratase/carnithine racemase
MKNLILSGPGKNALSIALMQRALAEVRSAGPEPIFLRGEGDAFSAGLNLKEIAGLDIEGMTTFLGALEDLVKALYEHPAPVVAWVNGHAIAGGCVIALTADVRVMTAREGARIGLNEVALGLRFPPVTMAMVRARLTAPAAERILLDAALYPAREAKELGLVDVLGEEDDARAIAQRLEAHPREIYASTKEMLRPRLEPDAAQRKAFREETIPFWASPERRAAMLAVLEKRK